VQNRRSFGQLISGGVLLLVWLLSYGGGRPSYSKSRSSINERDRNSRTTFVSTTDPFSLFSVHESTKDISVSFGLQRDYDHRLYPKVDPKPTSRTQRNAKLQRFLKSPSRTGRALANDKCLILSLGLDSCVEDIVLLPVPNATTATPLLFPQYFLFFSCLSRCVPSLSFHSTHWHGRHFISREYSANCFGTHRSELFFRCVKSLTTRCWIFSFLSDEYIDHSSFLVLVRRYVWRFE
jgi:hypothetical protein